ncbi:MULTISPECIES: DUF3618 domain-containing protein [Gordonia]|uniref:DUF3618 domain-containing protein n=2 Tax=Gordonia TaxID=2053 RepID=L7LJ36_9ACTN|nr:MULTISPECIES: DUF3618 domain-containing protein [Gordonia]AUH69419.1 DUF3618 domain-containing protein [Gordonia sp. YC-JH1]KJR06916.1 hypothetical protein UG54_12310 [Gordonia sihwensis]KXT55959.1 hypothetical protein Y710_16620 [Gordonia sp. QH-12]MBY4570620.1 hypothetical protein [Gordonia sihwensis]GAC61140.1 hypothetical protein GSI01S_15_00090 [Gordonia sihwensis NBRC 108236]
MADETARIEQEITKAREELAGTLDQLVERANPQRLADDAKTKAVAIVSRPPVKYGLIAVGALVAVVVVRKILR